MLQNKGKKLASVLLLVVAALTGNYVKSAAEPPRENQGIIQKLEKSDKQKAFEEQLAKKEAEFEQRYNEVKKRNDELRKEFDKIK